MEKNRSIKVIAIAALLIGVVGLSVGFAAFSNTLNIQSSLNVTPDPSTFNVDFSSSDSSVVTDPIKPKKSVETIVATDGKINNSGNPTITNLGATFTEPGQSVTYEFYAYNAGKYNAFLKSIIFGTVDDSYKSCTAANIQTTQAYVDEACGDISLKVQVGDTVADNESVSTVSSHPLNMDKGEKVIVTITYNEREKQQRADGDFNVEFGGITLTYSSVD